MCLPGLKEPEKIGMEENHLNGETDDSVGEIKFNGTMASLILPHQNCIQLVKDLKMLMKFIFMM